jgi:hypothetical protein
LSRPLISAASINRAHCGAAPYGQLQPLSLPVRASAGDESGRAGYFSIRTFIIIGDISQRLIAVLGGSQSSVDLIDGAWALHLSLRNRNIASDVKASPEVPRKRIARTGLELTNGQRMIAY